MIIEAPKYSDSPIVVADVINFLEKIMQLHCQYAQAKSGLVVGDKSNTVTGILICLDITEAVLHEAVEKGCNILIINQPLFLQPLQCITPDSYVGKCVIEALKHDLAIYVFSTNLDHLGNGASHRMAHFLELKEMKPIVPKKALLYKLTTFIPPSAEKQVIEALCRAGAVLSTHNLTGYVSSTSVHMSYAVSQDYTLHSYAPMPFKVEATQENQLVFIVPTHCKEKIIQALLHVHPYKETAYYLEQVEVSVEKIGSGVIGVLPIALPPKYFLKYAKTKLNLSCFQYTNNFEHPIRTVAIYAGEGGWLLSQVLKKKIDAFITAGLRYEQFLEASGKVLMIDVGYYSTRLGVKKLILALLSQEFNNIAILRCKTITDPIHYIND